MNKSQTSFLAGGDPYLAPFSSMTDGQLRDPKQLVGLARAIDPEGAPERLASGLFVAESVNVIDRALNAGCVPFAVLTDARWLAASEVLLEKVHTANPAAPVAVVSSEEMRSITGYEVTRGPWPPFTGRPSPTWPPCLLAPTASPCWRTSRTTPTSGPSSAAPPPSASMRCCSRRPAMTRCFAARRAFPWVRCSKCPGPASQRARLGVRGRGMQQHCP